MEVDVSCDLSCHCTTADLYLTVFCSSDHFEFCYNTFSKSYLKL